MNRYQAWVLIWAPLCGAATGQEARESPIPGQDYQSLQIASSTQLKDLQPLYEQYRQLPFLRVEKRGVQFTLRAGFWNNTEEARKALSGGGIPGARLRVAVLRPEALIRNNWTVGASAAPTLATGDTSNSPPPAPTPRVPVPAAMAQAPVQTPERPTRRADQPASMPPLRNMNPDDMALAYSVFLSTGDLTPALQIAQAAVTRSPSNREWRIRLARVAEWTQQPQIAAQQWAFLFRQGARDTDTLSQVTRLAWQMADLQVPIDAWAVVAKRRTLSGPEALEVLKLYEESAQPAEGSQFFEEQYRQHSDLKLLEFAARLAGNQGNDARALQLQLQVLDNPNNTFSLAAALDVVMLYVRSNRLPEALAFMQRNQARVPQEASEFWRLMGEVAWDLQQVDIARTAYGSYVKSTSATGDDWSRLVSLIDPAEPEQAALMAMEGYRRFALFPLLVQALERYAGMGNWRRMGEAMAMLQGPALTAAEKSSQFLLLRARYAQGMRQTENAWTDLRRAMAIDPLSKAIGLSSLWFLIEQRRTAELSHVLSHYQKSSNDADYWPAFAAAHLTLSQQREALHWYQRSLSKAPQDAFLLLNYADSLERNQQAGMAARVRRHAWLTLREKFPSENAAKVGENQSAEWRTMLRLALLNRPGDPALKQVRQWVGMLKTLPADASDTEAAELVLAWAISSEQFTNARTWMARRFQQQAPVWGRAQVALQTGDIAEMDTLLQSRDNTLPIYNRYDMERARHLHAQAISTAFDGMVRSPNDEALYDRFRQHASGQAAFVDTTINSESSALLHQSRLGLALQWPLQTGYRATAEWSRARQSAGDETLQTLVNDADQDQLTRLGIQWSSPWQSGSFALTQRRELALQSGLQLGQTLQLSHGWQWANNLNIGASSAVSPAMQVVGVEDSLSSSLRVPLDKRFSVQATPAVKRFYDSFGESLGHGQSLDLEMAYRLRMDYPDWRLRATVQRQIFEPSSALPAAAMLRYPAAFQQAVASGSVLASNYFLPESSTSWGLCMGMGENLGGQSLQNGFSRGWRPFGEMCVRNDSQAGDGYTSQFGVAGSLLGSDLMRIELQHSSGLANSSSPSKTLTVRYRNYF
ncbi:tetratricopeptide repeat protein [Rhodoferax sp.]|uniref:tetratricopeptide repeat protein n=1 Tax=Rhodoferax sp. TaxID=50421 RepID=UPI0025D9D0C2|nr:tetratricopeptide repeat protein [Rhodoferax sp.]